MLRLTFCAHCDDWMLAKMRSVPNTTFPITSVCHASYEGWQAMIGQGPACSLPCLSAKLQQRFMTQWLPNKLTNPERRKYSVDIRCLHCQISLQFSGCSQTEVKSWREIWCQALAVSAICEEGLQYPVPVCHCTSCCWCPRSQLPPSSPLSLPLLPTPCKNGWLQVHRRTVIWLWPHFISLCPSNTTVSFPTIPPTNATAHVFLIFWQMQLFFTRRAR